MIKIKSKVVDDVTVPVSPIPAGYVYLTYDGKDFVVYFEGDKLPVQE